MSDFIFIIAIPIIVIAAVSLAYFAAVGGWRYEAREQGISISNLRIHVYTIPYKNILSVEKLQGKNFFSWLKYWDYTGMPVSRLRGDAIFIETTRRGWKTFIITPDDVDTFLEDIKKHLTIKGV